MRASHNKNATSTYRVVMRFVTFFVLFYGVTLALFVMLGVFERAQADPNEVTQIPIENETGQEREPQVIDDIEENEDVSDSENTHDTTNTKNNTSVPETEEEVIQENPRIPARISAPSIGLSEEIVNPRSRDINVLNDALMRGVTYYSNSGYLGENGNIFLLGHSSRLPVVANQNYRVFNRISELDPGDPIYLEAAGVRYTYRVEKSFEAKDHEIIVDFKSDRPRLTLATCNVLGAKEDRFIIEAVLAETEKVR